MGNKSKKLNREQLGFIQIPILLLVLFGALGAAGGGYYVTKQSTPHIQQGTVVNEENDIATTSVGIVASTTQEKRTQLIDFVPTRLAPKTDLNKDKEHFQEFETKGKQLLALIEQEEGNFKLLTDTIAQHKKQSAEHATQIINEWITLVDQTLASTQSLYSGMLNSTKDYLTFDRDWVVAYSDSLYDIVSSGGYLLEQKEKNSVEFVKSELRRCLKMDAKEWVALNGESCTISFFEFLKPDYSKRLTDGANRLAEVDLMVLETIGKHARSAEDDVRGDMDSIARYTQLSASVQASFNSINNQTQQSQTQLKAVNTPIQCYTTTNSSIFDKNRTYNTTCQSDTRTPQQLCDEKIAAWAGSASNGAIVGAKPTCE